MYIIPQRLFVNRSSYRARQYDPAYGFEEAAVMLNKVKMNISWFGF
jgi:hypothetical protein